MGDKETDEKMGLMGMGNDPDSRGSMESKIEPAKPVAMPSMGKTYSFPREDNIFKGKESIPYDELQT